MHLIAVFDAGTAGPPAEMMVVAEDAPAAAAADVACAAAAALDALLAGGDGAGVRLAPATGFAARGAPHAIAQDGSRAALFYTGGGGGGGEADVATAAEEAPEAEAPAPAQRVLSLLSELSDCLPDDVADAALAAMADLAAEQEDGFATVAFDAETGTLIAARAGSAPLYWGTTPEGLLLLGADPADLGACYPSATPFPAGALFSSRPRGAREEPGSGGYVLVGDGGGSTRGRLASFVPRRAPATGPAGRPPVGPPAFRPIRTVPLVNQAGALCGTVFRVASEGELGGLAGFLHV